ncbi:MAG TPA: 6-phosphogluconolactonase [Bacteroidia bacterium]|jgi:6-phosphogluconolactonase|nr:6-phosphogluconolactonase [Bacteroidia bacterium]
MKPNSSNELKVFKTVHALNLAAAKFIIDKANKAVTERGQFVIALSGGQTPMALYSLLAQAPFHEELPWKDATVFWGDERCVPETDTRNNAHQAKSILLDNVDIPISNIHRVPVNLSPAEAASEYEKEIKNYFKGEMPCFDIILLGIGENGHTASLFPNTKVLDEHDEGIRDVYVEVENIFRVTMTAALINRAHNILFLVTGKNKAEIMRALFSDSSPPDKYPAQLIKPCQGQLFWFVDEAAASHLPV